MTPENDLKFKGGIPTPVKVTRPRGPARGRSAIWRARLVLLVMINVAQLWTLSATVEAALARHYDKLLPLVIASGVCWIVALTLFFWWKPTSKRPVSSGFVSADASRGGVAERE